MLDIQTDLLVNLLYQVVNAGGAGWLTFAIWKKVVQYWPKVKNWPEDLMRGAVLGTSIVVTWGAFLALGQMGAISLPTTLIDWINILFALAATAFTTSQLFHGRMKARQ